MAVPSPIVVSYHTASFAAVPLLLADGRDYFPDGQEPRKRHAGSVDTPDIAGLDNGKIYPRGNVRWEAEITRIRWMGGYAFPIMDGETVLYANGQEYAQKWLTAHLNELANKNGGVFIMNNRTWNSATLEVDGTTDNDFVILNYSVRMADVDSS